MTKSGKLTFDVLIEIPKGSRNKYEYDFDLKKIRFDRMLFSSMMYPGDYGFIPETLALDGDPLDVLVMGTEPTFPMCVMEVKPIGVFHMADEKGPDEKLVCVPVSDPIWNSYMDIKRKLMLAVGEMLRRLMIFSTNVLNDTKQVSIRQTATLPFRKILLKLIIRNPFLISTKGFFYSL